MIGKNSLSRRYYSVVSPVRGEMVGHAHTEGL